MKLGHFLGSVCRNLLLELAEDLLTLLEDRELDSTILGERDERLVTLAQDENVLDEGGPGVSLLVTHVDNVVSTVVLLTVIDDTNTAQVTTAGGHTQVTNLELDELLEGASSNVKLNDVVNTDIGVRVADGATVVGGHEGDTLGAEGNLLDLGKLVGSLLRGDTVDGETTLGIIEQTEVLVGALNLDNI
jgi:hypothetical protein